MRTYTFTDSLDVVLLRALKVIWILGAFGGGNSVLSANLVSTAGCEKRAGYFSHRPAVCLCMLRSKSPRPACRHISPGNLSDANSGENEKSADFVIRMSIVITGTETRLGSLRGICLAAIGGPARMAAAILSRADGELACDEAVINRIGEETA